MQHLIGCALTAFQNKIFELNAQRNECIKKSSSFSQFFAPTSSGRHSTIIWVPDIREYNEWVSVLYGGQIGTVSTWPPYNTITQNI
jgi:hypothetical protein